jgi:predicted acyltransferase
VLAGKLLIGDKTVSQKMKYLLITGLLFLLFGFGLDWLHITPIIKRIATSSFVFASGGYCLLFLAFCYWWIDIKRHRGNLLFFNLFALNSIFIYLFNEIVGDRWFTGYILTITNGIFGIIQIPSTIAAISGSLVVFALETGLLYFLYRRKIFFKL